MDMSKYCLTLQEEYPYHYGTLPANDQLYGGHPDFIAEVTKPSGYSRHLSVAKFMLVFA